MGIYNRKPDIIIRNGCIVDGTGKMPYYADLAIIGDKIDYIGDLKGVTAPLDIDAHHKYVTNGFIDAHSHSDYTIWGNPEAVSSVRQGVTTEVVGNCGFSKRSYVAPEYFDHAGDGVQGAYEVPDYNVPKGAMAGTLDKAEKMGISINMAWLCGHNDLRNIAHCNTREVSEEQYKIMESFLREAMEAGYVGFSTGLEFEPGIVSKPEEVERLAKIAAEYDANYSTHMRDEGTYILEAVNEFLNVIRKTGLRGTVSHLNVKDDNGVPNDYLQKAMQMLKDAREVEHLNVMCDMLPTPFATGDAIAILPPWLYENGWDEARKILADPVGREKVKADSNRYWRFLQAGQWERLLFVQPQYSREISTTPFAELVKKSGKEPFDCFLDIVMEAPTMYDAGRILMQGTCFAEQTLVDSVVKDPIYMWQTDGFTTTEHGPVADATANMQNYMSMTYFFARYVRDLGAISIQDACKKVGMVPAQHFMLEKRGTLEVGNYADVNVFDLNALKINATFTEVNKYSTGMDYVIVNGVPVVVRDEHTGARAGKVLRHLPRK
ncbi:MAG: amidohydrolase family protein [Lachnospiraceae bacterium]|nr:amidohydrolase family protein [Lachnospiraceae bacterium]